ncbi:nucleolin 1-like [Impatiens glandulifera]|uniref:nucleolin 1-like n=1 Tax=Impatiens glandulifera TaxID=253017 RepID=UPI001FB0AAF8|nr:nucleolin 1-like [Impatiens glandulifera]
MRSTRQSTRIVFGEPRPIPKPVEVIGKGKDIVTNENEEVSEATCIVDLMMNQAKATATEKIEIFDTWARRDNFNPLEKSAKAEEKALKRLDEIMEDYISVVARYVHGENCSGASPFESSSDEDEIMNLSDDCNVEEDEQAFALLIEMGNFSAEEKRLMAQPVMEKSVEPIQTNPSIEEERVQEPVQALVAQEKEVIEEPAQALISREEEVLKSLVLEIEASQEKEAESLPFPSINAANIHENIINPFHDLGKLSEIVHKVCEDVEEEEEKSESKLEKDEPEQSMQVHTNISPIHTTLAYSQEISSNEGSSAEGSKLMKSMTALIATLQKNVAKMGSNMVKIMKTQKEDKKEFDDLLKTHKEMELTLKRNTYEVHMVNKTYSKFEKNLFKRKSDLHDIEREINVDLQREVMDGISLIQNQMIEVQCNMRRADAERLEQADSFAKRIHAKEDTKAVAEKEKNLITQGEDNSGRRGGGVSTGTRSKRKPTSDDSDRPSKRGGGRNGDRGGRVGGIGRGGRSLPPFQNLLTGEGMSGEGFTYRIDPRMKREEQ